MSAWKDYRIKTYVRADSTFFDVKFVVIFNQIDVHIVRNDLSSRLSDNIATNSN